MTPARRWRWKLYRMPLGIGLLLSAPLVLLTGWYAWSTFAQADRYRRAVDSAPPLDAELFQLYLHDELDRDLRRLLLRDRPEKSALPTFELSLTRDALDALNQRKGEEGEDAYVDALVRKDGEVHKARVRYRGGQHWHRLMPQKSMKVRLVEGGLVDGARVFNLLNDATPFGLEDQIALDLARERGLLTPEYRPAWVRLNNNDLGVFRYEAQPDEGLLRRNRRMPGSLFSADADEKSAPGPLGVFGARSAWQKVAAASPEEKEDDLRQLEPLLTAVAEGSHREFAAFAERHLDLGRYALFDALDVVFGGNEHDYLSNHRLYVDPYSGRFEPVAWSFRGFQHEPSFNAVDHPLLIRLKFTPGYLALRDRFVYELLTGSASVPAIRARVDEEFARLSPELAADPHWDAYKLLPRASRFHRMMVRPMSRSRWLASARGELDGFARRSRFLLDALEGAGAHARWAPSGDALRVDVSVDGEAAWKLREIAPPEGCEGAFDVYADADLDGALDRTKDVRVGTGQSGSAAHITGWDELSAGAKLIARPDADAKRGRLRVVPDLRTYPYFVARPAGRGAQPPVCEGAFVVLESAVTGASLRVEAVPAGAPLEPVWPGETADAAPKFAEQERSPHPWTFSAPPAPEGIALGPGSVHFEASREFAPNQYVRIVPGTTLALAAGVTLTFRGRVDALGTAQEPIRILGADPDQPFAGIVLQGPGTAGSTLEWVQASGGKKARDPFIAHPALFNVHDTAGVTLSHVVLRGGFGADDVLHVASTRDLKLYEVTVVDARRDGIDLEFTTGELRGVRVLGARDDCLDLMGATVRVHDSLLVGCGQNAVSAGEESEVVARRLVVADSNTGVLSKNGAQTRITDSLVYRAQTALQTKGRELYYPRPSTIRADALYALECSDVRKRAGGTMIETERLRTSVPADGAADHLLAQVLQLEQWADLEKRVAAVRAEATR